DDTFLINNGAYYCSELIYELFMDPHDSTSLFELAPMTFKNANSDSFNTAWVDYYAQLKTQIPEGLPGINPGLIANSDNLEVIHQPVNQ
ncbi:MAG: hypothetical protein MRY83_00060, partial [Flavobacteriales bacterium]|nr:hypothetical protein [Flavobacteriales bacterium]